MKFFEKNVSLRDSFREKDSLVFTVSAILGCIVFCMIYGTKILNVQYDDWLMVGGDLSQHYLGWCFYRNSAWHFPIGLIDGLCYPEQRSVIYMDAIPLFAIFFKIISPILPDTFQYLGIWGIATYALMGGLSALVILNLIADTKYSILCSFFFIFSSTVLQRMYVHEALAGQWIIIFALLIYLQHKNEDVSLKRVILDWSLLLAFTVYIHMYFLPMALVFLFVDCLRRYFSHKKLSEVVPAFLCAILFALFNMWILGAFYGESSLKEEGGAGHFSANLNTLFNSQGASVFLKNLPVATTGQYEGYAFLGTGIIVLSIISSATLLYQYNREPKKCLNFFSRHKLDIALCAVIVGIFSVVALSPIITMNNSIIMKIPYPEFLMDLLSIFRATGRFVWPIMYLYMFGTLYILYKNYSGKILTGIIIVCLTIQIIDLSPVMKNEKIGELEYVSIVETAGLTDASDVWTRIVFVDQLPEDGVLYAFGKMATEHGLSFILLEKIMTR